MACYKISKLYLFATLLFVFHTAVGLENFLEARSSYNRRLSPNVGSSTPVKVSMYILDVMRVDDRNQEITAQMYFRQSWIDPRMRYEESGGESTRFLRLEDLPKIWHPDLFFVEESEGKHNVLTFPNTFVHWKTDGTMLISMRLTMTFRCPMDLRYFPHDRHTCELSIESYGYTADQLNLEWDSPRGPVGITDEIQVDNFRVVDTEYSKESVQLNFGNYSRLLLKLTVARKPGFYSKKVYIPYVLLTCISFLSLWISPKLVLARLSLTLSVLLIMFVLASHIQAYIPRVTYTKAIDVWMAFCIAVVFGVFLEFIILLMSLKSKREAQDPAGNISDSETVLEDGKVASARKLFPFSPSFLPSNWKPSPAQPSSALDYGSRFAFPLLFSVFNIIYWSVYAS